MTDRAVSQAPTHKLPAEQVAQYKEVFEIFVRCPEIQSRRMRERHAERCDLN